MPILTLTITGIMLAGALAEHPASTPPSSHIQLVALYTELSDSMFHGTIQAIDRSTRRVTVHTDFGRFVVAAIDTCEGLIMLRPGDRVRLDADSQGTIHARGETAPSRMPAPATAQAPARPPQRCSAEVTL